MSSSPASPVSANGTSPYEARQVGAAAALESIRPVRGRPSDALRAREAMRSYGFAGIIPRANLYNYRARAGVTVLETLRLVRDRDPDAAQAVDNFLLLMGQGYETTATSGDDEAGQPIIDEAGQTYLRAFDAAVGDDYGGGMDQLISVVNLCLLTQGAMAVELELNEALDEVVDVHPVDPARIVIRRDATTGNLVRGIMAPTGTPGASSDGFFPLNPRQFRYMPYQPDVDNPYGRSPLMPALAAIFFKIELLEDLKAVVHNQGYPRLDVSVVQQAVLEAMPAAYKAPGQEQAAQDFVSSYLAQLIEAYSSLQPDDTFIHYDSVKVDQVGGASGSIAFDALSQIIDTQIIAGLKQLPVMLGRNEGATTTHATVQWRAFALRIAAMQRITKRLIEWVHTTALQVTGSQSRATVTFDSQPTSDRAMDLTADETEGRVWEARVRNGWASQDEAANAILGHPAVSEVPPAAIAATTTEARSVLDRAASGGDTHALQEQGPAAVPVCKTPEDRQEVGRRDEELQAAAGAQASEAPHGQAQAVAGRRADGDDDDGDDDSQDRLTQSLLPPTRQWFLTLADDYPALTVAEQTEVTTDYERIVGAWFETPAGEAWTARYHEVLSDHYQRAWTVRGGEVLIELGLEGSFALTNPDLIDDLIRQGGQRIIGMNEETIARLTGVLADGVAAGDGISSLARRLRAEATEMSRARAEMIARTETALSFSQSAHESYRRNGVERVVWIATDDDRTSDPCRTNEAAGPIAVDAVFPSGDAHPPQHPNCRCAIAADIESYDAPDQPWTGA